MTVNDSDPRTLLIIAAVTIILALLAFGLSRLTTRLMPAIPKPVSIVACASLIPLVVMIAGFAAFEDEGSFLEWITTLPTRAYRNGALLFGSSLLGAWLGSRARARKFTVDPGTFD